MARHPHRLPRGHYIGRYTYFLTALAYQGLEVFHDAELVASDFIKWLDLWRQLTGFYRRKRTARFLWEEGYWDYTLRDDDSVLGIASYIVWNPVRAGLVPRPELYPFTGSDRCAIADIARYPQVKPTRR